MWSDTLLRAEQMHLLRLLVWGAGSMLAGVLLWGTLALRRHRSPLLQHFALQTLAWGALSAALAASSLEGLALRDHLQAVHLDRMLWLNIGLDAGYVALGTTLTVAGGLLGARPAATGAGLGIVVQGLALALLDIRFAATIVR